MDGMEGKVIRAPSLKRGKTEERITNRIRLEKVLGVTVSNNAALANDSNGNIAYPAGCTVVLFNTKTEQQSHIINTSRKTITSLAFSSCGRYIVTGECGHQPAVRVWDLQSDPQSQHPGLSPQPQQIAEFLGHKYGVNCVAFSPTTKYVVSVGTQHDMIVNVWDWKNNIKVASNKVSTKVKSIAFSENGSYFVTVGNRHVKFWYLEQGKAKYKEAVPLMGRSAILGEQRNNYFCDVACGKAESGDSTYAITRSGLLCEFNNRRLLDKWVELRTTAANCITIGEKYIFVGCAEGIIRCFDPNLRFITTLPRTHYLGVDVSLGTNITHMASPPADARYPDTIAITYDETSHKLTSIYNDHSIYVWDVLNIKRVGKSFSFLYHSACIWGVEMAPPDSPLPSGSFLTCGSDDTIRFWSLDKADVATRANYPPNIYSKELFKVVYIDKELAYLKDLDISGTANGEKGAQDSSAYDSRNGVRCIRISPDGKNLASGDRSGNIRIHDISTMKELYKIEAHDAEVLCLEYSQNDPSYSLMASASRDRLIHVFDVKHSYEFVQTLDDHSSSITAVRFLKSSRNLQMISCGADKSIIFRSLSDVNGKQPHFTREHNVSGKTTLYDMEVDAGQKYVLTACQDRNVRIYSVTNGKHTKSFKGSSGDDGSLLKVVLDRSGIFLATSCTDKSLSVYDYYSGECMATMCGHSELATGLRFTNDCRRLISASGDGCIFVWRVPHDMVITMHARLAQQALRLGKTLEADILNNSDSHLGDKQEGKYRFSIGQLPQWAKKQFSDDAQVAPPPTKGVAVPKGRWAQRAENPPGQKGLYSISPFGSLDRRLDGSDGSKDSSLDSGTDIKNYTEFKRDVTMAERMANITMRSETRRSIMTDDSAIGDAESTAHDGDIDSDNDYRHRPLYYPNQDPASGSEFTITNMDQDELRKSQRKKKPPSITIQPSNSTYGSNESDDDDDDASTPSGENTDRNPMSLLSVSSESLDHLVNREKYLQSTFESMSGAENDMTPCTYSKLHPVPQTSATNHSPLGGKTSISSKFLRTGDRNMDVINAVQKTKSDPEAARKRQELNQRIAETKKKLESVGHSTPLKYSQSIHDLSYIPVRDSWNKKKVYVDDDEREDSSLRRSCSLVDLSMPSAVLPNRKLDNVSGKKNQTTVTRTKSRYEKNTSITRSRSTTVLNASDSDNDSQDKKISRLMRPTISSHNKINNAGNNKLSSSRKKQSYSTSNLSTVGVENMSTSDDDLESKKPVAPPRNRSGNFDNSVIHRKALNNKDKSKASRHTIHFDDTLTNDDLMSIESLDLSSIEISNQLCEDTVQQLSKAAENVVKLYNSLAQEPDLEQNAGAQGQMERVRQSIIRTHRIFHDCLFSDVKQTNSNIDVNQTDTVKKLNDLAAKGSTSRHSVITIMEQYSDILLDMVQQKIHSNI
ncbi:mitogen-activated protein kinase-binding protein 1 isoform X3 [Aethina tumida]|uniref:mitogen-activated protein kinase-binding protein 1 isoform X3 n=1 Tax=Aethina tumida TaxID=116153 RepID=UPI0021479F07|nr:mitogen-activated protein kinase-binding protein 1 isoform X3 [Aethina tumida]